MTKQHTIWLGIFVLAALIGLSSAWLPSPLSSSAPANVFSAGRALEHIQEIAKAPHPTGSLENTRVRQYLFEKMRDLGLNPREMKGSPNGVAIVNLYGELQGSEKTLPPILLMAHYDTTPRGPGAADDSTGVAVALETIRALKTSGPLRNTIGVLLTDGEEVHGVCLGAYQFVRAETNLLHALRIVVNMEARGNRGPVLMFQTGPNNNGLIQLFGTACPLPVAASFSEDIYRRMPNDTDLTEFLNAGKRGYNFAFTAGIEFYHSAQDTPENLSRLTLQHYGDCVLPLARKLGDAGAQTLNNALRDGDATFFTLFRGLLVRYPAWFAKFLAFGTTALFAVALSVGLRRSNLTARSTIKSLGVTLLSIIAAGAMGLALIWTLTRIYKPSTFGPFVVGVPHSEIYLIALLAITATLTLFLRSRLLAHTNPSERLAGSLILWIIFTLVANTLLPGASYLFAWPALFGTIALFTVRPRLQTFLTAAPVPLLLSSTILLLHHTITIGIAPVSAAFIALAMCLETPANSRPRTPNA